MARIHSVEVAENAILLDVAPLQYILMISKKTMVSVQMPKKNGTRINDYVFAEI